MSEEEEREVGERSRRRWEGSTRTYRCQHGIMIDDAEDHSPGCVKTSTCLHFCSPEQ